LCSSSLVHNFVRKKKEEKKRKKTRAETWPFLDGFRVLTVVTAANRSAVRKKPDV
jgi:hypothetical protein